MGAHMPNFSWRFGVMAIVLALLLPASGSGALAQVAHSKNQGVAACSNAEATLNINSAITAKAGDGTIQDIAQQGHCFNLNPNVGFSVVQSVHVDGPNGGTDQVIGEVTLQDGSRTRFYLNKGDIDPNPSTDPNDSADPRPPAPADFGVAPFDPSKIPPAPQ